MTDEEGVPESERKSHSLADFLADLSQSLRKVRNKEEIDHDLELERENWEDSIEEPSL